MFNLIFQKYKSNNIKQKIKNQKLRSVVLNKDIHKLKKEY